MGAWPIRSRFYGCITSSGKLFKISVVFSDVPTSEIA